ncbi:MAG: ABC transporter permease [Ignavibacteriales bacterium]|nr:ABC transporter permease [Ignavibacteriales bacterium]
MNNGKSSKIKLTLEVAKWEFNRWFKLKDQIITLLISALISLLIFGGKALIEKFSDDNVQLVIINSHVLPIKLSNESKIKLTKKEFTETDEQKKLLAKKEIGGILILNDIDNIELIVNKKPAWLGELQKALTAARQQIILKQSNISQEQLKNIFQQAQIKMNYTETKREESSTGEKVSAGIFIGLMLLGVFFGLSYQFVAITGEKQLRITEVIASAISPKTWIDGKILGISLLSIVLLVTSALSTVVFIMVSSMFGSGWSMPLSITNPLLIVVLFILSISGFLLWNTFFSAIAATINDPNTSARSSLMMVPVIPVAIAFYALGNPDSLVMKILSLFPLTSSPVLSARLVLTDVPFIEILLSLILLILSIWYLRKAAGRIFSLSILMYGKEPSWKEISKWLRESRK